MQSTESARFGCYTAFVGRVAWKMMLPTLGGFVVLHIGDPNFEIPLLMGGVIALALLVIACCFVIPREWKQCRAELEIDALENRRCVDCGYSFYGLTHNDCPECGHKAMRQNSKPASIR